VADRSVSVPMTLTNHEKRDTKVKFAGVSKLLTLVPFDLVFKGFLKLEISKSLNFRF